jgi:hypothetical protein
LCYHYGVELYNFAHNTILQAATFVGICEGFLGIPVNWDLWVHLFHAELHTLATSESWACRTVRTDSLTFALRDSRKELYPPCTMTSNNANWEKGWFYLRNDGVGLPPYTSKVLMAKTNAWHHDVSPSSRQQRLESLTDALWCLADAGLGAASILANIHHRQIVPLMERELRIFETSDAANPTSLACSRLLQGRLLLEYAATRARRAISLKLMLHNSDNLWSFAMLPDALAVSAPLFPSRILALRRCGP